MTVSIVTDSAAIVPGDLVARHNIAVVPMQVTIGDVSTPCDQLGLAELLDHLDEGVTTAGPSPGDFATAIEAAPGDEVLVLTIASTMSSTHAAARMASDLVTKRCAALDTQTAAGAQGLVVLAAAQAASSGAALAEVEQVAARAIAEVRLTAFVSGLDQLVRSGRVPAIAGWAGRLIGVHPLFEFRDGAARRMRPAASREAALDRIIATWRRTARPGADLHVTAMHAMDPSGAAELLDRVCAEVVPAARFLGEFGPVMVAHTGPGLVGLAWRWAAPTRA